ncbi:prephenate dehydratase [soil metagenome]
MEKQGQKDHEVKKRISIQGFAGSFHQSAAKDFFGKNVEVIFCHTFSEMLKIAADKSKSEGGVMAIENSIACSILANYNLLRKSDLHITGEVYLHIRQNLLVNRGVKLQDIKEVHSHPMALQQCLKYLENFPWKLVEAEDTALSAKKVRQKNSKHVAAIAGILAADIYGLEVIAPDIHTVINNYTRFFILQHEEFVKIPEDANKATITFHTDNSRGSLAKVLSKIAEGGIDLSKLQSFPIPETEWRYMFGADMEFESLDNFYKVIEKLKPLAKGLKVYGVYKKGNTVM